MNFNLKRQDHPKVKLSNTAIGKELSVELLGNKKSEWVDAELLELTADGAKVKTYWNQKITISLERVQKRC